MKKKDVEKSFEVMFVPEEEIQQVNKVRALILSLCDGGLKLIFT